MQLLYRLLFILTAVYFVFIGGTAYYNLIPAVRSFHPVIVTLILGGWLLHRLISRRGLPSTPLNVPLLAVVGVWIASAALSIDPRMAFENLWLPLVHLVFFFFFVDLLQRRQQKLLIETQMMLAMVVLLMTGLEVASWYWGLGILPNTQVGWAQTGLLPLTLPRVGLAMNISTLLAGYVAPLVTVIAVWGITQRQRAVQGVFLSVAALLGGVLFLTFSRGGWISLAVALGFLLMMRVLQRRVVSARVIMALGGVVAVGVVGVLLIYTISQDRRSGDEGRVDMWRSAIAITSEHPVLGVGAGLYGRAFRDYRDVSIARDKLASAHNAYLNTAAEAGVIGVVVSVWLGVVLLKTWLGHWRSADPARKLRLEATLAALLGLGVHSLVDAFTITPIVLLIVALAAYCVVDVHDVRGRSPLRGTMRQQWAAGAALIGLLAYAVWLIGWVNPAYLRYVNSLSVTWDEAALVEAQAAHTLDPDLRLYALQVAYLTGLNPNTPIAEQIAAYEHALQLEPTWDVGWLNLAALHAKQADHDAALEAFSHAIAINPLTVASFNRARYAEHHALSSTDEIMRDYVQAIENEVFWFNRLPLSTFWAQTPARLAAVRAYLADAPLAVQYRVWAVHDPALAKTLITQAPTTADEWWMVSQAADDPAAALAALDAAIALAPKNGDYYVARARLRGDTPESAADLALAQLIGTTFESVLLLQADWNSDLMESLNQRTQALSRSLVGQEFAAVLYGGRVSQFKLYPEINLVGAGQAAIAPFYTAAAALIEAGNEEVAARVYQVILTYAPEETEAQRLFNALNH